MTIHSSFLLAARLLMSENGRTVVPNLKSELKTGLYHGLLRNLEITEAELLDA